MKRYIINTLKIIMVLTLLVIVIDHKRKAPRILVVHSYYLDYAWTRDVNVGLKRVFDTHCDISIRYHYMDLKRHKGKAFRKRAATATRKLISTWRPNVLVLFDNWAQELIGEEYSKKQNIQIVFGGLGGGMEECRKYYKTKNVTGILEGKPFEAIGEILQNIAPDKGYDGKGNKINPKIAFIGTRSRSITAGIKTVTNYSWEKHQLQMLKEEEVGKYQFQYFEEWADQVKKLSKLADILLVENYRTLEYKKKSDSVIRNAVEKKHVDPRHVMAKTHELFIDEQGKPLPVVGMNYFNVLDGGALAVGASPYEQGEVAASMAVKIAKKESKAEKIPIVKNRLFLISMREKELEKMNINLNPFYRAFARATGYYIEKAEKVSRSHDIALNP